MNSSKARCRLPGSTGVSRILLRVGAQKIVTPLSKNLFSGYLHRKFPLP